MSNYFDEYDMLEKDMAKIVRDIVAERERQGISQGRLAEMAGIKQSAVSRIENLSTLPQLDTLMKLLRPLSLKLVVEKNNLEEINKMNTSMSGIKSLFAETFSCRLKVSLSEDENLYFTSDEPDEFVASQEEHLATIRQKKPNNILKNVFQFKQINAEIKLPKSFAGCVVIVNKSGATHISGIKAETLDATSDNGKTEIENTQAEEMKISSDNGKIVFINIKAGYVKAANDNGKIIFANADVARDIVVETDNGKISAENVCAQKLDFKTDNGAIILENAKADNYSLLSKNGKIIASFDGNEDEFSMEISTKAGSAMVGGKKHNGSYIYKDKDKQKHVSAVTKNGRIALVFSDTASEYKEQIKKHGEGFATDFEEVFALPDLESFGEAMKDGMKAAKQVFQRVIRDDDGERIIIKKDRDGKKIIKIIEKDNDNVFVNINVDDEHDDEDDEHDDE